MVSQQAFFYKKCVTSATHATETARWSDIFQSLISAGHDVADIQGKYTQRQIELYFGAIQREKPP